MVPTIQINVDTISGIVADEDEVRAGLLYDVQRNTIVWEKDMDYAYPIASLTKMMVGLLAIEDIEAGKVHLTDTITVTRTFKKRISRRRYSCVAFEQLRAGFPPGARVPAAGRGACCRGGRSCR